MAGGDKRASTESERANRGERAQTDRPARAQTGGEHARGSERIPVRRLTEPVDTLSPPIAHEELASSNLIAEAIAQLKAGARLQTDSDRKDLDVEDLDVEPFRLETAPLTPERIAEITATAPKESRPLGRMSPMTKPPYMKTEAEPETPPVQVAKPEQPAKVIVPLASSNSDTPAVRMTPLTKPPFMKAYEAFVASSVDAKSGDTSPVARHAEAPSVDAKSVARFANAKADDAKPAPTFGSAIAGHSVANPLKRMPAIRREDFDESVEPPRSNFRFLILGCLLAIAVVAMIALLAIR